MPDRLHQKRRASSTGGLRRVAVLVETSTTWGRAVLRGVNSWRLSHGPWEIFVEARGIEEHLRVPAGWQGDGVIARVTTEQMARELRALKLPVVNVSAIEIPGPGFPQVRTDFDSSAKLAAKYFLERGFRHFAYFGLIGLDYVKRHREVFAETVKKSDGSFDWLGVRPMAGAEPDWRLDLASLGEWLKRQPRPLAVLCWNASSAREIVFACHETGLSVPEEVAVLSQANDEALCETALIPISGISVSGDGIGLRAAEMLDNLMRGRRPPSRPGLIAPHGIVTRQSTDTLAVADQGVAKALHFLRQNAHRPIQVNELAVPAGISRRVLERRFVDLLGRTPADEIRRAHLERARQLLVETDCAIADVAERSGFSSQAYFADAFRRQFGATPFAYRRKNRVPMRSFR